MGQVLSNADGPPNIGGKPVGPSNKAVMSLMMHFTCILTLGNFSDERYWNEDALSAVMRT